ncbi:MAG: C25 family cysteine peptidase, partial [Caldisericia bacterium]
MDPLIIYHESQELKVYYVQVDEIDNKITPQKIRDFLLEKKDEWNLKFLLIAGTHEKIPMLVASPDPDKTSHSMVTNTPTDYYYATPSANWDKDGDGIFGELKDDGIASFEPEIYVGRIPFDTDDDVLKISHYISRFDSSSDAEKAKCLFPGGMLSYKGQLWEGGPMERGDGGYFSELVYADHLEENFSRYRMYESEGFLKSPFICEDGLTNTNLKRHFSKKYGLVCWTGHGSPERVVRTVWNTMAGGKTIPGKDEVEEPKLLHSSELKRTD